MALKVSILLGAIAFLFLSTSFGIESPSLNAEDILYYAIRQYTKLSLSLDGKNGFIHTGNPLSQDWEMTGVERWTVGFYGGTLWMLYKMTGDSYWKTLALDYQERVKSRQFDTGTHDVGFVIMSTYGLALEYGGMDETTKRDYETIINQTAISLSSRFHPLARCIRSWNSNNHPGTDGLVLVIIDNMMNLELLFKAFEITGNQTYYDIALSHANRTIEEHFRENDQGIFHVVGYKEENGEVGRKYNHQGMADNSTWSRGLAWAIHGYTTTYMKTKINAYLETAEKAATYFIDRLPSDSVPYWDFDAPLDQGLYQPRDTSAAAIAAHGFLNLFEETGNREKYFDTAEKILIGLEGYRADAKQEYRIPAILVNGTVFYYEDNFNTAITYADFYYLRAVDKYREIIAKL